MLKDRASKLHQTLRISSLKASEYTGFAASGVGFIRNGKKKPKRTSSTMLKYTNGIRNLMKAEDRMDELNALIGYTPTSETTDEDILLALMDWLYQEEDRAAASSSDTREGLILRIDTAMQAIGINNHDLSKLTNIDSTTIGRLRRGIFSPYSASRQIDSICSALAKLSAEQLTPEQVGGLTGQTQPETSDRDMRYAEIRSWLLGPNLSEHSAITELLKAISAPKDGASNGIPLSHDGLAQPAAPAVKDSAALLPPELLKEGKPYYIGVSGLRRAVSRFLGNACASHVPELLLYSDQNMKWLIGNMPYCQKWTRLMKACLANGMRIRIIHNIERGSSEMISAITNWMPLYMTGLIEPYYNHKPNKSRFANTLFLAPGFTCLYGSVPVGAENSGIYQYTTDPALISAQKTSFEALLSDSSKLLDMVPGIAPEVREDNLLSVPELPDVGISIQDTAVYVVKKGDSPMTFRIMHPSMRSAFRTYCDSLK